MPYRETWIEPEIFCAMADGTKVYHTYRNDDAGQGQLAYWFTLLPMAFESCDTEVNWSFDVRDLPEISGADIDTDAGKKVVIQAAYDAGLLLRCMDCPAGCDLCILEAGTLPVS